MARENAREGRKLGLQNAKEEEIGFQDAEEQGERGIRVSKGRREEIGISKSGRAKIRALGCRR